MHSEKRANAVAMPKTTIWPMVLSLGLALIAASVALGAIAFAVIGLALFASGLWGWLADLLPGRGHEWEALSQSPAPIAARPGTVESLKPGVAGYRFRLPEKVHPISAGLKGGIIGGLVMPIPALIWGMLSGHGIWFPVNLLAGLALPGVDDLSVAELEQFRPTLFTVAIILHAAMSATIGLLNGVILPTMPVSPKWQVICGGVVMPLLWSGFSYGSMRIANPALALHVDWWSFAAAQFVFGLTASIVVVRTEKVAVPPAGRGEGGQP